MSNCTFRTHTCTRTCQTRACVLLSLQPPTCEVGATVHPCSTMDERTTPLLHGDDLLENEERPYVAEKRRWLVLLAFSFANLCNAVLWVTFAAIAPLAESFYGVSDTLINSFSVSYLVSYIPGSVVALLVYSFRKDGLRRGVILSAALSSVGATIRYWASPKYGITLFGQYLCALAQPFLTNVPPKLATAWFPASERDVATVLASMSNPVGIAVGSILPAVLVSENDGTVNGLNTLLLVEAILATMAAIVAAILVKSRPAHPPSAAAEQEALESRSDSSDEPIFHVLSNNVLSCMSNRHFLVLFVAFGIGLGMFNALTTLTEQLIAPYCYTDDDASLFTGLLLGCGLLSAGTIGVYLDKSHEYRFMLKLLFTSATVSFLLYAVVLRPNARWELAIVFSLLGAAMLPILPSALEAAVECTYPVPEEYSTGLLMSAGMLTGVCFIIVLQRLADAQPPCDDSKSGRYYFSWPSIVLVLSGTVATVIILQFRGPLLRVQAEQDLETNIDDATGVLVSRSGMGGDGEASAFESLTGRDNEERSDDSRLPDERSGGGRLS